jgi:hypothetical protein
MKEARKVATSPFVEVSIVQMSQGGPTDSDRKAIGTRYITEVSSGLYGGGRLTLANGAVYNTKEDYNGLLRLLGM